MQVAIVRRSDRAVVQICTTHDLVGTQYVADEVERRRIDDVLRQAGEWQLDSQFLIRPVRTSPSRNAA